MRKPARSRSTQQTPPQSSEAGTRRTFIPECTISEERAIQCKEWLKHNSQPLNQVEQYMQDTAVYRAKSLRENGWDIQGIRQEFPHLFTPGMIAQDFQILHREAAPKLFETWLPLFKDKILHLARREGKLISSLDGLTPGLVEKCSGTLSRGLSWPSSIISLLEQTWWSTSMRRRCQDLTHMSCPWETIFGTPLRRSLFLMGRRWNKTHCFRQSMSVSRYSISLTSTTQSSVKLYGNSSKMQCTKSREERSQNLLRPCVQQYLLASRLVVLILFFSSAGPPVLFSLFFCLAQNRVLSG
ncbi:uncharacterized protein [Pseudochaenichthys georgianus]|uniref:uncharacterized protein n=1 Tax=Pseudochaenichthys georgianus TaxID=52239 RepID=UPI00146C2A76|nr:uncharacterized protein LOC117457988 [Pseudochaenichthys georgianus]XP_033954113.1 uncharacterized protein LOC117457988 [Pseudochaenichthys georgianus]